MKNFKKPSRKTVADVTTGVLVVGGTAATLIVGLKVQKHMLDHVEMKMQLTMAYTLINKVGDLHPQALTDAVAACDKELLDGLITVANQ